MKPKKKNRKYIPMVMGAQFVLNRSGGGYHKTNADKRKQNKYIKDINERLDDI